MSSTVGVRVPLFGLVGANTVSLLGNTVAAVAIPWFVLVTTGSAARTGLAAFATTLPLALGAFFGGTIADRVGARTTSVVSDLASAGAIAGIPLLHAAGVLEFWHVVVLAFLGGLFDAPGQAAREALLPETADRAGISRERASALWTTTEHTGYVLGAPLAGVLIATIGAPAALWLDAASFLVSAVVVVLAVPVTRRATTLEPYARQLADGLRFVARNEVLTTFLALAAVGNFLIAALGPVLLPVYAREEIGGPRDLGFLVGAYGLGGLGGAIAYGLVARRVGRDAVFVVAWATYPLLWWALVALPKLGLAVVILVGIGLTAGAIGPLEQLLRQEQTPIELRGRVFATFMASLTLVVPPAVLLAGIAIDAIGLRATLVAFAIGNTALAAFSLVRARRVLGGDERRLPAAERG